VRAEKGKLFSAVMNHKLKEALLMVKYRTSLLAGDIVGSAPSATQVVVLNTFL
jgi:hypothetical protein